MISSRDGFKRAGLPSRRSAILWSAARGSRTAVPWSPPEATTDRRATAIGLMSTGRRQPSHQFSGCRFAFWAATGSKRQRPVSSIRRSRPALSSSGVVIVSPPFPRRVFVSNRAGSPVKEQCPRGRRCGNRLTGSNGAGGLRNLLPPVSYPTVGWKKAPAPGFPFLYPGGRCRPKNEFYVAAADPRRRNIRQPRWATAPAEQELRERRTARDLDMRKPGGPP